MKQIFKIFMLSSVIGFIFSSCLKSDLPQIKDSDLKNITDFIYFYKYQDTTIVNAGTPNAQTNVSVKTLTLNITKTISNDTVYVTPTFSASFPLKEKVKVSLTHINATATIPNAASIEPLNGAPVLGLRSNWGKLLVVISILILCLGKNTFAVPVISILYSYTCPGFNNFSLSNPSLNFALIIPSEIGIDLPSG